MGLLTKLVMLPLAPVAGVAWIAEQLEHEAVRELYGPESIRRQLATLGAAYERGEIGEAEYLREEEALLDRLDEALAQPAEGQER